MKLVFVDETSDNKYKDYFGLCCAVIDAKFYDLLKSKFHKILSEANWETSIEFKGAFLFSASKGDTNIDIDTRIDLARKILELNKSEINTRIKYYYLSQKSTNHKEDYLKLLPILLRKAIPNAQTSKGPKNLLSLNFDFRDDISKDEIKSAIMTVIKDKNYRLLEEINCPKSGYETVGILYADIAAYLYGRVDTISNDLELFENLTSEQLETNGKIRKLKSSRTLIDTLSSFNLLDLSKEQRKTEKKVLSSKTGKAKPKTKKSTRKQALGRSS